MPRWQGKSKGTPLGYRIFILVCKNLGLIPAYALLRLVAFYYFIFSNQSSKVIYSYFRHRHHFNNVKSILKIYKNYYYLGQSLLDKMVVFAGLNNRFTFHFDGIENLKEIVARGKGGILLSAHVGNWEMAGHHLEHLNTKINIVMFDGEHQKIKKYLEQLGRKNFNVIVIKEDMSHVYDMGAALANKELVCMHADRFLEGNKTISMNLLGGEALFPIGPFLMAAGFNVPVSMVYAFKETSYHYHYFGSPLIQRGEGETKSDFAIRLANFYVDDLEKKIKSYPEQWYNYYDFLEKMKGAITDYIPQRPPMVMIDKLIHADETTAVSSFRILPTTLFVENGKFTEPGLVENIAQTAAAMVGHQCFLQNASVPIGFIAGVKDLKIIFIPDLFSIIQTKVAVTNTVMNVTIIEAHVEQSGKLLCSCEMKILIQKK